MANFAEAFAPAGFDVRALAGGYGLAEATLMVSTDGFSNPPRVLSLNRDALQADRVVVAESGYLTPDDVRPLHRRCDAVLVGSALMTHDAPDEFIEEVASWT